MPSKTTQKYTFKRNERLKSRKKIQLLFRRKYFVHDDILKLLYDFPSDNQVVAHQFSFAVPKKIFNRAVDRNYIKRLMREVIRLNKSKLLQNFTTKSGIFIISYTGKQLPNYSDIEQRLLLLFQKIK